MLLERCTLQIEQVHNTTWQCCVINKLVTYYINPTNNLISFACLACMWDQTQPSWHIIWFKCPSLLDLSRLSVFPKGSSRWKSQSIADSLHPYRGNDSIHGDPVSLFFHERADAISFITQEYRGTPFAAIEFRRAYRGFRSLPTIPSTTYRHTYIHFIYTR